MIHSPSPSQQVDAPQEAQPTHSQTCDWDCAGDLPLLFHDISILAHTTEISSLYSFLILQILSFAAFLFDPFIDSQFSCWTLLLCFWNCWEYYLYLHTLWYFLIQSWTGFLTSLVFCCLSPLWSLRLLESRTLRSFCHFLFFHFQHWGAIGDCGGIMLTCFSFLSFCFCV